MVGEQVAPTNAREQRSSAAAREVFGGYRPPPLPRQVATFDRRDLRERREAERRRRRVDAALVDSEPLNEARSEGRRRICGQLEGADVSQTGGGGGPFGGLR